MEADASARTCAPYKGWPGTAVPVGPRVEFGGSRVIVSAGKESDREKRADPGAGGVARVVSEVGGLHELVLTDANPRNCDARWARYWRLSARASDSARSRTKVL